MIRGDLSHLLFAGRSDAGDNPLLVGLRIQTERTLLLLKFQLRPDCFCLVGPRASAFHAEAVAKCLGELLTRHFGQAAE